MMSGLIVIAGRQREVLEDLIINTSGKALITVEKYGLKHSVITTI